MKRLFLLKFRCIVLLAICIMFGLLLSKVAIADEKVLTDITNIRSYNVFIAGWGTFKGTGRVTADAIAQCSHGSMHDPLESVSGDYYTVTIPPPDIQTRDLSVTKVASVTHAYAYASASIIPTGSVERVGENNVVNIEVLTLLRKRITVSKCYDGDGWADAVAYITSDPIVFGSASYTSSTGDELDPFPPNVEGTYRYVEQSLALMDGNFYLDALPGPSPFISLNGQRLINGYTINQYVRSGSDDNPNNISGTLVYQIRIYKGPDLSLKTECQQGTNTTDFAFSFNKTQAQIEQDIHDILTDTGNGNQSVLTVRVTMLRDESDMPNMTLVGYDQSQAWGWESGNPNAIELPIKWWQGPNRNGPARTSNILMRADDFKFNSSQATTINAVRWWGTYGGEVWSHRPNVPFTLSFQVDFYNSDGTSHPNSLPVNGPPVSTDIVMANRFFVNWTPTGDALYEFNAYLNTPFNTQPGQEYFISIADTKDTTWQWQESTSTNMDQPALRLDSNNPWLHDMFPDMAFALMVIGNTHPDCSSAYADKECLWPPNSKMVSVNILGVTDPDADTVSIVIDSITSDEPTATGKGSGGSKHAPDADGVGTDTAILRAERSDNGDGRVYEITFNATDGKGGECSGSVQVKVPYGQRKTGECEAIDNGQIYDATGIN